MTPPSAPRPSLFDLQVNGFAGVDFQRDPPLAAVREACLALRRHGAWRILATLISERADILARRFALFEQHRAADPLIAQTIAGYHLEGPYLSAEPGYRGAHRADVMKDPDWREFGRWQEAARGAIRLVTLAPERRGAPEFIAQARAAGVVVSLGHTNASESEIDTAIAAGATLATHVGNGCPAHLHRHDNIIQRLLARDELTACFIPDGIHVPAAALRNFVRAKPPHKIILTTDAMAAAGAPPGRYTIGHLDVEVAADGVVREPGATHFAGSALTPAEGIRRATAMTGLSPEQAWTCGSTAVADLFGVELPVLPDSFP